MDSIIPTVIITAINVIGWIYTRVYAFGRLNEKVERHEKLLNDGIVGKLNNLESQVSNLDGTVHTYIDLAKNRG
jgi:hypothetical protein